MNPFSEMINKYTLRFNHKINKFCTPILNSFRGITLAHNVGSKNEVEAILKEAIAAGAKLVKPAQDVFWGGYSGYFADLDGHLWEIAWNPHWPLQNDGMLRLPE